MKKRFLIFALLLCLGLCWACGAGAAPATVNSLEDLRLALEHGATPITLGQGVQGYESEITINYDCTINSSNNNCSLNLKKITISNGCTLTLNVVSSYGDIENNGTLQSTNGIIHSEMTNNGTIKGGTFNGTSDNPITITNKNIIEGGTFNQYATVENKSMIRNGASSTPSFAGPVNNTGTIQGGSFSGKVTNGDGTSTVTGIIAKPGTGAGPTFTGSVINNKHSMILDGTFTASGSTPMSVTNNGSIHGGTYSGTPGNPITITNKNTIEGGTFCENATVENQNLIQNGTSSTPSFACPVNNAGTVKGGSFSGKVTNNKGLIQNPLKGNAPKFTGDVENIAGDSTTSVIKGGVFEGTSDKPITISNGGPINGGTFNQYVTVNNSAKGTISDGTFDGNVNNSGCIEGGSYMETASLTNMDGGVLSSGRFLCYVLNQSGGRIQGLCIFLSGRGTTQVKNEGLITGSVEFWGNDTYTFIVDNYGTIEGGSFKPKTALNCFSGSAITGGTFGPTTPITMHTGSSLGKSSYLANFMGAYGQITDGDGKVVHFSLGCPQTHTITFDGNGGTIDPADHLTLSADKRSADFVLPNGQSIPKSYRPTASRTGYIFSYWYEADTPNKSHTFTQPHTTDITLYAAWREDPCTITFNSNGGSAVAEKSVLRGSPVAEPAHPTRAHHVFAGWYLENSDTAFDFSTPITTDTTLVARWTAMHAITTQANPVAGGAFAAHPEEAVPGTALTLTITTNPGYSLAGVTATAGGTALSVNLTGTTATLTMPDGPVTVTASFDQLPMAFTPSADQTITLNEGETATLTMAVTNAASYQWQVNTGNGWQPCDGGNTTTLALPSVPAAHSGYRYRLTATTADGRTGNGPIFTLHVAPMPTPTPSPVPKTGDSSQLGVWAALVALCCAGMVLLHQRKAHQTK